MSSDSPLSDAQPSDAVIEEALRNAVREVFESGALEELTVKRIRKTVEKELDLADDLLKTDQDWKERSKNIISAAVVSPKLRFQRGLEPTCMTDGFMD